MKLPVLLNSSLAALTLLGHIALGQVADTAATDAVRVNITVNPDGSRTAYQFDPAHHQATATTTTAEGKPGEKIHYELDDAGRFARGRIFGPDGQFRFRSVYKYDAAGKLEEESQFGKDDRLRSRIVYAYDQAGKQSGYSIFDGTGKLLGRTSPGSEPSPSPKTRKTGR
jgi:hypothetical protein